MQPGWVIHELKPLFGGEASADVLATPTVARSCSGRGAAIAVPPPYRLAGDSERVKRKLHRLISQAEKSKRASSAKLT